VDPPSFFREKSTTKLSNRLTKWQISSPLGATYRTSEEREREGNRQKLKEHLEKKMGPATESSPAGAADKRPSTPTASNAQPPKHGCCETLGLVFGSILPEIWISSRAIFLAKTNMSKFMANSEHRGTGFWFIANIGMLPKSLGGLPVSSPIPGKEENHAYQRPCFTL
jgi:hypothetical protein